MPGQHLDGHGQAKRFVSATDDQLARQEYRRLPSSPRDDLQYHVDSSSSVYNAYSSRKSARHSVRRVLIVLLVLAAIAGVVIALVM